MAKIIETPTGNLALTFDDVLLVPGYSKLLPSEVDLRARITKNVYLNLPIISAAMDTVTEAPMAIAMAQAGGLGIIHRNMSAAEQAEQVRRVKKFEAGMVLNPITIEEQASVQQAIATMSRYNISAMPVIRGDGSGVLVGILTNRDIRFADTNGRNVADLMTFENLITVSETVSQQEARKLLHQHRIERLIVVDDKYRCIGLITVKDIEKSILNPGAAKDAKGRLLVGAASTVGPAGIARAEMLCDSGVDVLVIDTAHGHSQKVLDTVSYIKKHMPGTDIIAGNVAMAEAAKALIDCGADCVKVGIGPGSICTTRIVAGVGVPQLSAIMGVVEVAQKHNVSVIADGGIKFSGDMAKAIAAGASAAMIGSLLAGCTESPGEVYTYQGRPFKSYRGMGSIGAMVNGSADRYFQSTTQEAHKLVPEGVEGQVAYKGDVSAILRQLEGGLRAAMGYVGAETVAQMHMAQFVRITNAGLSESHTHNVAITKEAPNYYNLA
ncbi:MAG: IMP dehydrogenase [Alphaproteobacteria bacterium]|nr:IMP dehydrogenase [Alphaproteobacteria bacterium]